MGTPYSIKVYKQYFNFAASHFLLFENGTREPLHGHNYRVFLKGKAPELKGDMVFDFLDIKPIVRELCNELDHKLILPGENISLKIYQKDKNFEVTTPDGSFFSFPTMDVLVLPIVNTSAERLAIFFATQIKERVFKKFGFVFSELEVEVEETPGQSAVYESRENQE